MTDISSQFMALSINWRRIRRKFDARLMTERRIIIIAAVCVTWLLIDTIWVTPSYQRLKKHMALQKTAQAQKASATAQTTTLMDTLREQQGKAIAELNEMRQRFAKQEEDMVAVQSQMAPASDMRQLLQALLAKHGQLRVLSMKTLPPQEVRAQGSADTVLYRHGLVLEVGGQFHDLLAWLQSAESMPRRLIWQSMVLGQHAQTQLVLKVQVYTLSPDKDALEIAP
jgi:MSHA biogenesis protein MshJ